MSLARVSSVLYCNGLQRSALNRGLGRTKQTGRYMCQTSKKKRASFSELRRILFVARPEYGRMAGAAGLLVVSSAVTLSVPMCMGRILDVLYDSSQHGDRAKMKEKLTHLVQLFGCIFVVGAAANCGRVFLMQSAGQRITRHLRHTVFTSVLRQEMAFFDRSRTGELVNRLAVDTTLAGKALTDNLSDGLRALGQGLAGVGMMTWISPQLTLISVAIVPPIGILAVVYGRFVRRITQHVQTALAGSTEVAEERISNVRTVRSFGQEETEVKRYSKAIDHVLKLGYKEIYARSLFFGAAGLSGNMVILAVLWNGGMLMHDSALTVGQLTSFLIYAAYAGFSIGGLSSFYTELMKGIGASSRLWDLCDREAAIPISGGRRPDISLLKEDVVFSNIGFSYPSRADVAVFDSLHLRLKAGCVTAVVGASGSGKSSLASLLLRLYDPDSGSVQIGGEDIRDLDPQWLRQAIGTVSQEPVLFSGTIADNLAYSRQDILQQPKEEKESLLWRIAEQANANTFIKKFPDGLYTEIGEHGVQLSGGQKQRIAIARALLKDPEILILDEATSALDAESERLVHDALDKLMKGRTVLTIAHRLSTIKNADAIAVLHGGSVAEFGTYKDLMALDGHFRKLVERQTIAVS